MLTIDRIYALMQASADSLKRSGVIERSLTIAPDTVIFGSGSPLDSIGFVSFVTDVEERVGAEQGTDISIALLDIENFNENQPYLTAERLATYLTRLVAAEAS